MAVPSVTNMSYKKQNISLQASATVNYCRDSRVCLTGSADSLEGKVNKPI